MVGVQGFEPWTPCSQSRCATRLRYTPTEPIFYTDSAIAGKSCKIRTMVAYFSSKFTKQIQAAFSVALLLFCLLGTHWIGFAHSVSHAGLHSQSIEKYTPSESIPSLTHSSDVCHLFDALTLASFVPSDDSNVFTSTQYALDAAQFQDSILTESKLAAYQSRAPPTFIL